MTDLPTLRILHARAEHLVDELDRLIADIEVALDGHPVPDTPCIEFIDLTDIRPPAGAAFHVAGGVG